MATPGPPEPSQPSANVLLSVAPTGLRERRASAHALANARGTLDMTGISAVPENAILDIEDVDPVKEDVKQPTLIPQIPTLSQLPSLYIDKQSASISGYTPGSITPGYSGSNTPAVARETYFEDAFKSSGGNILNHDHSPDSPRLKRRLALSFFGFFCAGWSDGITGTVLPRFEETYHVNYLTVSFLFVASTVGVETGISLSQGRCGVLFFGGLSQAIYFTIAASKAPFPAMVVGFGFSGIGISLLSGQYNAFVAAQKSAGRYLGWLHGFYGVGAFASPLVGQTLLARGWEWPRFFIISEFREEKAKAIELLRHEPEDIELENRNNDGGEPVIPRSPRQRSRSRSAGERNAMRMTLSSPIVWIFAIFLCTYVGSETTTGGWVVSYLLKERNADPDTVGYVASGFWGGLAVGRLLLGQMSPYIGLKREKHLVHIYIGIALLMTILVWKVPSSPDSKRATEWLNFMTYSDLPNKSVIGYQGEL
ncbi:Bypass of stop codon protein 6 [Saccharomyces cerevisiae S288c] [Rhizoctonia solani]|uniref:Bypass of stop codon protein 6 [Saccharomyces cerevisiae S288c] n=1 Tax=Rhizoctonia solani TaxID=456999 RepID=A0A0K6FQ16_9AGAM|nr:Bypass of stop codon protein 6 [Saccharomyces cerevisiae S288c] [Rhizoctonia solani]